MATVQVTSEVELERVIQGMSTLQNAELEQVVSRLSILLAQRKAERLPVNETKLLKIINQTLPIQDQQRYQQLQGYLSEGVLTAKQHEQLLHLNEKVEQSDAERLKALLELSHLRGISLDELMQQLGLSAPTPHG